MSQNCSKNGHFYAKCRKMMDEIELSYQEALQEANDGFVPLPNMDFSDDETVPEVPQGQATTSSTAGTNAENVANDDDDFDHGEHYPNGEDSDDFYHGASDENDSYEIFDHLSLLDCLRFFAIKSQLPRSVVNMLLAILRKKVDATLPKDSRTLVRTPPRAAGSIYKIGGGDFWYGGLSPVLTKYFQNIEPRDDPFKLDVSVDGLPLHKGGPTQVWPILVKAVDLPKLPLMLVAAYSGHTKPASVEEFLRPLVNDFNIIQRGGLTMGDKTLQFRVRNFIADTPARAFILGKEVNNIIVNNLAKYNIYFIFSNDEPQRIRQLFKVHLPWRVV
uniref:uncharacterized protein LOC120961276 n=1 Tax=Anopheles coluzzii TaxID=1518534 RepID=UPI0020FF87FD|nr:uncharacterized protein LOC120961276 [Anopheles coluzzii]